MKKLRVLWLIWKNRAFVAEVIRFMDYTKIDRALLMEGELSQEEMNGFEELRIIGKIIANDPKEIKIAFGRLKKKLEILRKLDTFNK